MPSSSQVPDGVTSVKANAGGPVLCVQAKQTVVNKKRNAVRASHQRAEQTLAEDSDVNSDAESLSSDENNEPSECSPNE